MSAAVELRAFRVVVAMVLVIPILVGGAGALGGLEGLAALFGEDRHLVVAPSLRNHLRAICWMFFAYAPLIFFSLRQLAERAWAFRLVVGMAAAAGLIRLTGYFVDGPPGALAVTLMLVELIGMPGLLVWHARLIRRTSAP